MGFAQKGCKAVRLNIGRVSLRFVTSTFPIIDLCKYGMI